MNSITPRILFCAVLLCILAPAQAQKYNNGLVDKIIALVGNEMIQLSTLEADVAMMMNQGVVSDKNIRCQVLENMLIQKLLLNQARLDSLPPRDNAVEAELENRIQEVKSRLGGDKGIEDYFHKPLFRIKQEWREQLSEQVLTMDMRTKLQSDLPVLTPKEVEQFYNQVDKDSLPIIPIQYQIRQIVVYPSKEDAVLTVRERLLEFRERILNGGASFATLASTYSEDPGTVLRGGELGLTPKQVFYPSFTDAAMALRPGQVSQIVETPDGFHLIQLIEKKDDMFNARHILLRPKFGSDMRQKAFKTLDSLKTHILADSLSFGLAATRYSMDPKSRLNNGLVADENTGSTYFEKDQLNPTDYNALRNLEPNGISEPYESTDSGLTPGRPNDGRSGNTIYKIIRLEKIIPAHPANITDDYQVIMEFANNRRAEKVVEEFIVQKQKTTYIRVDPLFEECAFQRSGWVK